MPQSDPKGTGGAGGHESFSTRRIHDTDASRVGSRYSASMPQDGGRRTHSLINDEFLGGLERSETGSRAGPKDFITVTCRKFRQSPGCGVMWDIGLMARGGKQAGMIEARGEGWGLEHSAFRVGSGKSRELPGARGMEHASLSLSRSREAAHPSSSLMEVDEVLGGRWRGREGEMWVVRRNTGHGHWEGRGTGREDSEEGHGPTESRRRGGMRDIGKWDNICILVLTRTRHGGLHGRLGLDLRMRGLGELTSGAAAAGGTERQKRRWAGDSRVTSRGGPGKMSLEALGERQLQGGWEWVVVGGKKQAGDKGQTASLLTELT
ncbi:hypothetical protein FB45DRAFT_1005142 [Roridomyces roridus]|uniref:Uncharacterized protein n=1 Tax=Roridomyces roridus TaxID=1738132 RepID=A0AAD7BNH2_9AGAR|nr:hypothetical protein FB45DRAFT_1005142 [Roridomyces roridus]